MVRGHTLQKVYITRLLRFAPFRQVIQRFYFLPLSPPYHAPICAIAWPVEGMAKLKHCLILIAIGLATASAAAIAKGKLDGPFCGGTFLTVTKVLIDAFNAPVLQARSRMNACSVVPEGAMM